ncbi:hypothetical protein PDIG_51710 [Penicillium digitatum PHI26]|uniref:Uncharacterized protein n=2 Tax=Penicillium digitatum TaxID=36651 RepID=K9FQ89_PEND2|nr:hypothetical protein PDIP_20910 [Penicillium digitatum Pd1]EKV11334.1 hypothetical protein PDIG_51710 [Penicillium digitatum PHI26]EKV19934.1 hypothetical protein PDIP_20910 [Penicillium digitatum Pd1]
MPEPTPHLTQKQNLLSKGLYIFYSYPLPPIFLQQAPAPMHQRGPYR